MIIRDLKKEDIPAIEALYDLYWTGSFRENLSRRLRGFVDEDPDVTKQHFKYLVAEEDGCVVGVGAFRDAPDHMRLYAHTLRPVEFYILAVRDRGKGVGTLLRDARIEKVKKLGYTEILFFSGETHKDSWDFHDRGGFERISAMTAPDGERGFVWGKTL